MTYNLSLASYKRWSLYLDTIKSQKESKFASSTPDKLAYSLREALSAAKHNKVPGFKSLRVRFEARPGYVLATHKSDTSVYVPPPSLDEEFTIDSEANEFDVVAAVNELTSSYRTISFVNFIGNLKPLDQWNTGLGKIYSISHDGLTLIVTRK